MTFNVDEIRAQFPILSREINGYPLAYLDNAASAQKPRAVIDAMTHQMGHAYANVHRGLHTMAMKRLRRLKARGRKLRVSLARRLRRISSLPKARQRP